MRPSDSRQLSRRDYLRGLVALGGASGLSACMSVTDSSDIASGDPNERPLRQHAWNDVLTADEDGNRLLPEHHVLVPLRLVTAPDEDARTQVESAFRSLERAYAYAPEGVLFAVGYSAAYFDRIGGKTAPIPAPRELTPMESPAFDTFDAVIHLASDHPAAVLEAEEALFGATGTPNGAGMEATLSGVFERADPRRTGFVGAGLPAEHTDVEGVPETIPEEAPSLMGFRAGFRGSQAPEDRITIREGPFEGGTTMHISSLNLQLDPWYGQDSHEQRVAKLFSPEHTEGGASVPSARSSDRLPGSPTVPRPGSRPMPAHGASWDTHRKRPELATTTAPHRCSAVISAPSTATPLAFISSPISVPSTSSFASGRR